MQKSALHPRALQHLAMETSTLFKDQKVSSSTMQYYDLHK